MNFYGQNVNQLGIIIIIFLKVIRKYTINFGTHLMQNKAIKLNGTNYCIF